MTTNLKSSELGKKSIYETKYNPKLLFSIPRSIKRQEIGIDINNTGFNGIDIWTHYEISWLNPKGKPIVAIGEIRYPASSNNIIESKSMKLYFNSFNNTKFNNTKELINIVIEDISKAIEAEVEFNLIKLNENFNITPINNSLCLDELDIECDTYIPNRDLLYCESNEVVEESLHSNLLKSNCLVTNQPDWGTIFIEYLGKKINHNGLLKYIISLRNHNEFHEQCVERIFHDIKNKCSPKELTVYARYTRRGGLDINPYRSTKKILTIKNLRLIRQ